MYNMKNASRNTEYKQVATPETLYYNSIFNKSRQRHSQTMMKTNGGGK